MSRINAYSIAVYKGDEAPVAIAFVLSSHTSEHQDRQTSVNQSIPQTNKHHVTHPQPTNQAAPHFKQDVLLRFLSRQQASL